MRKDIRGIPVKKIMLFALFISLISSFGVYLIQRTAHINVDSCSYLDPLIIDILAFLVGAFLVTESIVGILIDKKRLLKYILTRCVRMSIGFSILTVHIMQFIHK